MDNATEDRGMARLVRYAAALVILFYGFAKINGAQFTILDSELDKPLGQVSGFWLTWHYFGFSPVYGAFLALTQIAGAMLLTFRRSTLLGACLLAPVLANIVLIDLCYAIDSGATLIALLLLIAMIWLISIRWPELRVVIWPDTNVAESPGVSARTLWAVRAGMLAATFIFTFWIANYNNRSPTPIDGVWDVLQVTPTTLASQLPATIFFERNRACMAVFKTKEGSYETHHFELDTKTKLIRVWQEWLKKEDLIFEGNYYLSGADLSLNGSLIDIGQVKLRLHRRNLHL